MTQRNTNHKQLQKTHTSLALKNKHLKARASIGGEKGTEIPVNSQL